MAGSNSNDTETTVVGGQPQETQTFAFVAMTCLFFFWGFITVLNDILIPFLKESFELNYTQAMLVQFCFFGAYFIVSPFAGKLIDRVGFQVGIVIGLKRFTCFGNFVLKVRLEAQKLKKLDQEGDCCD